MQNPLTLKPDGFDREAVLYDKTDGFVRCDVQRTAVERVNSHLHDEPGGRHVRVRGAIKVAAHLAFGLVAIAAEQMLKLLG